MPAVAGSARIKAIVELASGFLYYVSLKGTTGSGKLDVADVESRLKVIRGYTRLPICVGFGIKTAETAAQVAKVADGVVIGSALVQLMAEANSTTARVTAVADFCRSIRVALDQN